MERDSMYPTYPRESVGEGGFAGYDPVKRRQLMEILDSAAARYPTCIPRVQPKDNQTQTIFTLAVLPKIGTSEDPKVALQAWKIISTGTLDELLAFSRGAK